MSTNCRDSRARPFFVVTAAERITIVKNCYRLEKIKRERRRGWLLVARTKSPGLPLRLFWCVRRRSKRCATALLRCRAADRTPGSSAAWRRGFCARLVARQKKRSRPGNCARRRSLQQARFARLSRLFVASVLPLAAGTYPGSCAPLTSGSDPFAFFLRSVPHLGKAKQKVRRVAAQCRTRRH